MDKQWDQGGNQKDQETNENEHTTIQNVWNTAKTVLRDFHSITESTESKKISNNLTLHLKELKEQKQTKPIASRRK